MRLLGGEHEPAGEVDAAGGAERMVRPEPQALEALARLGRPEGLAAVARELWAWLGAEEHRPVLTLWVEGYARSLVEAEGPWSGFARATVEDWLEVLGRAQPDAGESERTLVLAVLRGALLDLLATGDLGRTTAAVHRQIETLAP